MQDSLPRMFLFKAVISSNLFLKPLNSKTNGHTWERYYLNLHFHLPGHQINSTYYHIKKSCGQAEDRVVIHLKELEVLLFSRAIDLP